MFVIHTERRDMMKKILVCFTMLFMLVISSVSAFGEALSYSVVFKDGESGVALAEIGQHKKISAEIEFVPTETGSVSVIVAGFDNEGFMKNAPVCESLDVTEGERASHTTEAVSSDGADKIKVFVFAGNSLKPLLSKNGIINSAFEAEKGFSEKFESEKGKTEDDPLYVLKDSEIKISDIVTSVDGVYVNSKYFNVSSESGLTFNADASNWENSTVKFATEGTYALNFNDYSYCIPTTLYVKAVGPVDRYTKLFKNTNTYLYRVGNKNAVSLSSLFKEEKCDLEALNTVINVENVQGDAAGVVTLNTTDWTKSSVQFSGTGVVSVTISDDNSKESSLLLEVIDAKNITKAESATANDVVLLNDISGTFTVSNNKTFYGNGFTVKLPTSSAGKFSQGFTGYINLGDSNNSTGGNLDNVIIEGPVYPEMYIYREQAKITDTTDPDYSSEQEMMHYFKNSVIVYAGDCTISNSIISGSRTAVCLRGGNNILLENTTLSGGSYANMQIGTGCNVTLRDVTTVQTDVLDSYGKGKIAHGLGIAVDSNVANVYIEGKLNQYNWISESKWSEIVPSTYQSSFPKFFTNTKFSNYWHYLNGGEEPYVNLAFIYACAWNKDNIHDYRSAEEMAALPYATCDATIASVSGGIYSKVNTNGNNTLTDSDLTEPKYVSSGFKPAPPVLNFDNSPNYDEDDANDAADTYCVYNNGVLDIGMTGTSKTLDLSKVTVTKNGSPLDFDTYLNGALVSGTSVEIKEADGAVQKLTFKTTVSDLGFGADGNPKEGSEEHSWDITVNVATLSYPAPSWNMGGDYEFAATENCVYGYYGSGQYGEAVPIYEGIKISYYNKEGTQVNLDLSGTSAHPTGSANSNSNAFTYTLSDGSTLTMKFASGWKSGATTHQFTTYNNKVYIYPQSLDNDNYVRAKTTNQDFDVKINYTFTDPNGQSTGTQTMRWYNPAASNGSVSTVQWKTFDSFNGKKAPSICVTGNTLVTLSDGTKKRIDEITYDDEVLVWDFYNGCYTSAPVSLIVNHGYDEYEIISLTFDDGTNLEIVECHGVFNKTLNEFVDIDSSNVDSFVGDAFLKSTENGFEQVRLLSYEVKNELNTSYALLSAYYHNAVLNNMFTISPSYYAENLYEAFEVDDNMTYDAEKMQADIEKYGLYTYEEFSQYLTKEQFEIWKIANMKVVVGKGWTTYEVIVEMLKEVALPNA